MAHGAGARGQQERDLQGGNVKVECVLKSDVVETGFGLRQRDYFPHYACGAWLSPASIARGENYYQPIDRVEGCLPCSAVFQACLLPS